MLRGENIAGAGQGQLSKLTARNIHVCGGAPGRSPALSQAADCRGASWRVKRNVLRQGSG